METKMRNKGLIISGLLIISAATGVITPIAQATSYSTSSKIVKMTSGKDFARVRTEVMAAYEQCEKQDWYILEFGDRATLPMYSMLLAAKASQQKISFQLQGCKHGYAVITHVYSD